MAFYHQMITKIVKKMRFCPTVVKNIYRKGRSLYRGLHKIYLKKKTVEENSIVEESVKHSKS